MSVNYAIKVNFTMLFSEKIIQKIITRALNLKFAFRNEGLDFKFSSNKSEGVFLNQDEIFEKIMNITGNIETENFSVKLVAKYLDTWISFLIFVYPQDNTFSLELSPWDNFWEKKIKCEAFFQENKFFYKLDVVRYARLLLKLVEKFKFDDFQILENLNDNLLKIPKNSIKSKFAMELSSKDLVSTFTDNIIYNECIFIDSYETQKIYNYDKFKELFFNNLTCKKYFQFIVQYKEQFLEVSIEEAEITLSPISETKTIIIENEKIIDIPFYIRLMLGFCENLVILELGTNFYSPHK